MSITGRFEADFQSFYAAVDKAEAKLTDFQSGAGRVEQSLNRMVDSFSGRRLIQEATLTAAAIERIGGTTKLTGDEMQRAASKAADAVAKMKAMGIEVPPGIAKVASELKPVNQEMGFMERHAEELATKLLGALAVEKVVEFALNVGKAQQQLSRLSIETQINTDELQDLTAATADYGIENAELAKALFNVSKGIAGGDDSVARGLHQAGLTLDELKGKHGKELFLEIEAGLAKLQGSARDAAAADIFGSKLGASMAGFATEADKAVAAAGRLNEKLSPAEIQHLKDYADEVERLERNFGVLKDRVLGGGLIAIDSANEAARKGVSYWSLLKTAVQSAFVGGDTAKAIEIFNAIVAAQNKSLEAQGKITEGTKQETIEISKESQAAQFLSTLRRDAAKELEGYQVRALEQLRSMGQLNQQNAAAVGVSVDQFKKYTEEVRASEAATKALTSATIDQEAQVAKLRAQIADQLVKQRGTQTQIELANIKLAEDQEILSIRRRADALTASLIAQHADTKENLDKIASDAAAATLDIKGSFDKLRAGVGVDWDEIRSHSQEALDDIRDRAKKTYEEAFSNSSVSREELEKLLEKYRAAAFAATRAGQAQAEGQRHANDEIQKTNLSLTAQFSLQQDLLELERTKAQASSFDVTAANFDRFTAPAGLQKDSILVLLKQGFSIKNAIDILQAQKRGVSIDLSQWPEDARGPRVPGFKYGVENFGGGPAIVGEDGPELLNLPPGSSVIPMRNGFPSGGVRVYAPTYVSGVFDPYARHALTSVASETIMRRVLAARVV